MGEVGEGSADPSYAGRARAELTIQCGSSREARVLWEALSADDPGSAVGLVEGDRLVIRAGPVSMASLRTTLDDLLACAQAASGTAGVDLPEDEGEVG